MHPDLLNSWKEIAAYLGRGVRTVQRWEIELSLPVHRPHNKSRSAVIASRAELNGWLRVKANPWKHAFSIGDNIALLRAKRRETRLRWEQLRETMQNTRRLVASLSSAARRKSGPQTQQNFQLTNNSSSKMMRGNGTAELPISTIAKQIVINFEPKMLLPMQSAVADPIAKKKSA